MTTFTPQSWIDAADRVDAASQDFQAACDPALNPPGALPGLSKIDAKVGEMIDPVAREWYYLIGGASIKMGSDASKMRATAKNYSDQEAANEALAGRYWS